MTPAGAHQRQRLHGLDALRAGALLLGIVLHSLLPFSPHIPWRITDVDTSTLATGGYFVIHLFRMPLFMLLAGYFSRMTVSRKGLGYFIPDRLKRIALPLIIFWPVAVLAVDLITNAGYAYRGQPIPPEQHTGLLETFRPGTLWFLWVLLECYLIMIIFRALMARLLGADRSTAIGERIAGWFSHPAGVLVLAVPYAAAVLLQGGPYTGGVAEPPTLVPEPFGLLSFFTAFATGWLLRIRTDALERIGRGRWIYLAGAIVATGALAAMLLPNPRGGGPLIAPVAGIASWCLIFALVGLSLRYLNEERPAVRYLADASYWMYLLHLPLLLGIEIFLADRHWPFPFKLVITWAIAFVLLVLSYHLLVRSTWIGKWLNGRRYPWSWPPLVGTVNEPKPRRAMNPAAAGTGAARSSAARASD